MNEEAAFLRAICEQPDDDTPRLAFADWLTERGGAVNLAWANGIRAQVWMAPGATDEALGFQACVFESNYGQEKLRERLGLRPELVSGWERGFPVGAAGPFRELRRAWPRLGFRVPIRKLYVYDVSEADAGEFVTWPGLSLLTELELLAAWESPVAPDLVPLLADCAALGGLKSLTLRYALFNEDTVAALLDSPHLAGLTTLRLGMGDTAPGLSRETHNRLLVRFGEGVFDDSIPF